MLSKYRNKRAKVVLEEEKAGQKMKRQRPGKC